MEHLAVYCLAVHKDTQRLSCCFLSLLSVDEKPIPTQEALPGGHLEAKMLNSEKVTWGGVRGTDPSCFKSWLLSELKEHFRTHQYYGHYNLPTPKFLGAIHIFSPCGLMKFPVSAFFIWPFNDVIFYFLSWRSKTSTLLQFVTLVPFLRPSVFKGAYSVETFASVLNSHPITLISTSSLGMMCVSWILLFK